MAGAVVFDINETVLDLEALDPLFASWFGETSARRAWFAQSIHFALTLAATREYRGFGAVGMAALETIADEREITLPAEAAVALRYALIQLPAHPDVKPALELLRSAGFTTVALSNNPLAVLHEQLRNAEIAPLFDFVISVEEAAALKPAPEVYRLPTERLQLPPRDTWMIAAHGWDIAGGIRAGLRGAFVARPGQIPDPFAPPEIIGDNLVAIAAAIIEASEEG
jgi:2-haloacid dehalogenase